MIVFKLIFLNQTSSKLQKKPNPSDGNHKKLSTPTPRSALNRPSSEMTILLNNEQKTPTPLPTLNEFERMKGDN